MSGIIIEIIEKFEVIFNKNINYDIKYQGQKNHEKIIETKSLFCGSKLKQLKVNL